MSSTFQDANEHECVVKAECIDTMTDPVVAPMVELPGINNFLGLDSSAILDVKETDVVGAKKEVSGHRMNVESEMQVGSNHKICMEYKTHYTFFFFEES